jgi:hypothetical protein
MISYRRDSIVGLMTEVTDQRMLKKCNLRHHCKGAASEDTAKAIAIKTNFKDLRCMTVKSKVWRGITIDAQHR